MIQQRAARWVKHNYSPSESVTRMLDDLDWRSLENRLTDACLIMFHRIIYGYVAIQVPSNFDRSEVLTRHMHPFAFRHIHTYASYCLYSFYPAVIPSITKTYLFNFDPLKPHFYIVKLGFTGIYIIFLISAQNIDCGYSLEPPRRGGSNEYPQSMF